MEVKEDWEKYNAVETREKTQTEIMRLEENVSEPSSCKNWEFYDFSKAPAKKLSGESPVDEVEGKEWEDEWRSETDSSEECDEKDKLGKPPTDSTSTVGKGKRKKSKLRRTKAKKNGSKKKSSKEEEDSDDSDLEQYKFKPGPGVTERFKEFLDKNGHLPTKQNIAAYQKWVDENPDIKEELDRFFSNDKVKKKFAKYRAERGVTPWFTRIPFMGKLAIMVILICLFHAYFDCK